MKEQSNNIQRIIVNQTEMMVMIEKIKTTQDIYIKINEDK